MDKKKNSLKNIVLSSTFLISSLFLSLDSKSQEFDYGSAIKDSIRLSPEEITNYYEHRSVLSKVPYYSNNLGMIYAVFNCDLDDDGFYDLMEIYDTEFDKSGVFCIAKDTLGNLKSPWGYIFKNKEKNTLDFFFDFNQNMLNGDEILIRTLKEEDSSNIFL